MVSLLVPRACLFVCVSPVVSYDFLLQVSRVPRKIAGSRKIIRDVSFFNSCPDLTVKSSLIVSVWVQTSQTKSRGMTYFFFFFLEGGSMITL